MNYKIKERILKNLLVEITKKYDYMINEYKAKDSQSEEKLLTDYLTSLLNRDGFKKTLLELSKLSSLEEKSIAVITLDLDNFKIINTSYGYEIGDLFLKEIGKLLKSISRSNWTVARIGGDEFGIAIYGIKFNEILFEVERIKSRIENFRFKVGDSYLSTTVSVGVSIYSPDSDTDILSVLNKAEVSTYQSKTKGKNIATFSSEDIQEKLKDLEEKKNIIVHAINNKDAIKVYVQPIVSLKKNEIIGGELLLRIEYRGKIIPAVDFIESSIFFGLLPKLEKIQLDKFLTSGSIKKLRGRYIFINRHIKAGQLKNIKSLIDELSYHKKEISGINFVIEITENSFVENFSYLKDIVHYAKKRDILFAVDDFGAGFASFGYVSKVPIDIIKIDGSIINECISDKKHQAIVKAISILSRELDMKTVAEFIDSIDKLKKCTVFDIDYGQGFYFNRPLELEDFLKLL
ncbi:MAG TPA: GGDEF domain-containing protein [Persephonella sp.]|uniref:Diguanylate cyclase/phosphodiesterase n=1 Tax=Persephonella marina (strain DSM 14350 / EX-H1) TaxID=123214 RepID=C0QTN5_PERMH|nr:MULTISPECIES: GGDEF and EAL domain-containing protein [Persephonella]ACO04767.1 diguanylate cyclase/phosphodiesterase [Persephonella marina EX-H1]HCB70334.1 GGDEF domain-containing protein [Persephonella sp.]